MVQYLTSIRVTHGLSAVIIFTLLLSISSSSCRPVGRSFDSALCRCYARCEGRVADMCLIFSSETIALSERFQAVQRQPSIFCLV